MAAADFRRELDKAGCRQALMSNTFLGPGFTFREQILIDELIVPVSYEALFMRDSDWGYHGAICTR